MDKGSWILVSLIGILLFGFAAIIFSISRLIQEHQIRCYDVNRHRAAVEAAVLCRGLK